MRTDLLIMDFDNSRVMEGLQVCAKRERKIQSMFLAYLAEVDVRKLYAVEGYSSLSGYLIETFNFSESSALKRIQVARMARKFPQVYSLLEQGEVSLSALSRLSPFINRQNDEELLTGIRKKSVRGVEKMLADRFPLAEGQQENWTKITPISSDRVRITFCADASLAERIGRAKEVMAHKYPEQKLEQIIGEGLDLLLKKHDKNQTLCVAKEKQVSKVADPNQVKRYIPRGIQTQVWERDGGSCAYVAPSGKRCGTKAWLEWDHIRPWAMEGSSVVPNNIRLLCRRHNQLVAEQSFGKRFIGQKVMYRHVSTGTNLNWLAPEDKKRLGLVV